MSLVGLTTAERAEENPDRPTTSRVRPVRDRRLFATCAALATITVLAFAGWIGFRIGGDSLTTAVDDIGEAVAASLAALSCALAASRSGGRRRLAWYLLAASATSWGMGEVIWSAYEVVQGISVPFPSLADVGFLGAVPLAVVAIFAFSSSPRGTSTSLRLWLDGLIVALSLIFVGWALGLSEVFWSGGTTLGARLISLAYPLGDILIGTVLVLAIRRATTDMHGQLLLLLAGLAANAVADSAFAYLNAGGNYGSVGSVLDTGWILGYLLIALAAVYPRPASHLVDADAPIDVWQVVLPWCAVLVAGLSAVNLALNGRPLDSFLTVLAGVLAVLLMISQALAQSEARTLLIRSRLYAATLNDVIAHAPVSVVRISPSMTLIQANPGFSSLLQANPDQIAGSPISRYFPRAEATWLTGQLHGLATGSVNAVQGESRTYRTDLTSVWLHWSATVVRQEDGEVDYFIAMFEDTTARHQADAAAARNLNVLERLSKLKTTFLTMVSHELRTALVGIQGFSELIRDTDSLEPTEVKSFASEVYNEARRIDQMLDKMLELDRAEGSQAVTHITLLNLNSLAHDAVSALDAESARRIVANLDARSAVVRGDRPRLLHLITILLSNAIKYSPPGSEVLLSSRDEPGCVRISFQDHGAGMPADFDDQLFRRRESGDADALTEVVGSSLGLPTARQIVELHGGRIWYRSVAGMGSEFHVSIPAAAIRNLN